MRPAAVAAILTAVATIEDPAQHTQTMGQALTLADAGEMLGDAGKDAVLGRFQGSYPEAPDAVQPRMIIASDQDFTPGIVEHGIELCRENRAMLELLCIYTGGDARPAQLTAALPCLVSEADSISS